MTAVAESGDPVIVALGSNLGDSSALLERAFVSLAAWAAAGFRRSSVWKSAPVDCPPGSPDFLNAVCLWYPFPDDTPEKLLDRLQTLEREFGRRPKRIPNEPRVLDLDLVAFGRVRCSGSRLTLPHPRAHVRRFVLGPLAELVPDWEWPGERLTVSQLLARLGSDSRTP